MKTFNGRKMSHGPTKGRRVNCPICLSPMVNFRGVLRCTEIKRCKGTQGDRRMVKHGSFATIRNRLEARA